MPQHTPSPKPEHTVGGDHAHDAHDAHDSQGASHDAPEQGAHPLPPRIAHVGIAIPSLDAALPFFRDVLGMPEVPLADSDGARIAAVASGESLVELLEPVGADTPIGKYLAKRGAGIHHICLAVADLDAMLARCRDAGVRLIDETPRMGAEGKRIAFLHPSSTAGILVELTEL